MIRGANVAIAASHHIPLVTADVGLVASADLLGVEAQILRQVAED